MAAGITQPGGNGGDILFQDDANVDASLDGVAGSYHFEDLYQKSQAAGWKDVTGLIAAVEKWGGAVFGLLARYWFHVSIQNGDGALTTTTTLNATRCEVVFDAGKTYKVSATGLASRWTKLGLLQETVPFDPIGYDGVDMTVGAGMTIDGNHQIYGSKLRLITAATTQRIAIQRASTSQVGDSVNLTIEMLATGANSSVRFGSAAIRLGRARHIYVNCMGNASTGNVEIFNVLDADDIHFGGITNVRLGAVNAYCFACGMVFSGTPGLADMRGSGGGTDLVDAKWSGAAPQVQFLGSTTRDWRTFSPVSQNILTGAPLSGDTMNLYDKIGTLVVGPIVSDANGQFPFTLNTLTGIPVTNAVIARVGLSGTTWTENGPFTAVYSKAGYADTTVVFSWPRSTGTFGDQLYGVYDVVPRRVLTVAPTADFRYTPGGGLAGVTVQFTDESLAGDAVISSRIWDFGDGASSVLQNPAHTYTAPGTYSVTLTVTTSFGTNSKTVAAAVYVSVSLSPFTRQPVSGVPYEPLDVPSGPYVPKDVPDVDFVRQIVTGSPFTPCGDVGEGVVAATEDFVIFTGVILPTGEPPAPRFRHRGVPTGSFGHRPIPAVDFQECGTPSVPEEEDIIFAGVVIPADGG